MVLLEGDEEEVTNTSTSSATPESAPRAEDSSATATPSLGTPSDSLDRNVDPKQIMNSSENIQEELQEAPLTGTETKNNANENDTVTNPNLDKVDTNEPHVDDSNASQRLPDSQNEIEEIETTLQTPPPSYSALKEEAVMVEKSDISGMLTLFNVCDSSNIKFYHIPQYVLKSMLQYPK